MFGAVPGVFRNKNATVLVSIGYQTEEEKKWTVVSKTIEGTEYFKPCSMADIKWANEEGWFEI